jgi:K+-transporting ATPase ATPase A chain
MTRAWLEIALYLAVLLLAVRPLGAYMARVLGGEPTWLSRVLGPLERLCYRVARVDPAQEMGWKRYAAAMLFFNMAGILTLYLLQRVQHHLPLNPQHLGAVSPGSAFNTAVSYATNTNWQGYSAETTMSYLTQMAGLTAQNFVSAATGIAVLAAFIRGFTRRSSATIGNFWADLVRSTLYILLPLSIVLSLALVSQGVVQTLGPYPTTHLVEPFRGPEHSPVGGQVLAVGPAASQVAIRQLGTNGGGFFHVNAAHPFENPTPLSCFLELLAILIIPGALCYTFGRLVGDPRQGWAVLTAMTVVLVGCLACVVVAEQAGNPLLGKLGVDQSASAASPGGNMEGKEARFGIGLSALWAVTTTAASNGSVNAMHDSFTPLGGMVPMWLMQLGEVIYGGAGSGLYGMLAFAIIAVFVAGLMVGRTPEYLGKKIEAHEMKMASLMVLLPPFLVLVGTALSVVSRAALATLGNPGVHGFTEVLYAFSSASSNNGSAFAGLGANTPWYNPMLGLVMFLGRYWLAVPALAIAGSLAAKKHVPSGAGTLPTHTPLFVLLLVSTVLVVGALTFLPALALGPIAEHLMMSGATP